MGDAKSEKTKKQVTAGLKTKIVSGNEALALGALRAGVKVVSGYPGTPSSGALSSLINMRLNGRYDALARAEDAKKGEDDKSFSQTLDTGYGRIHLQTLPATWLFATDAEKVGMAEEWFAGEYDDKDWKPIRTDLGAGWGAQGFTGASSDAFESFADGANYRS